MSQLLALILAHLCGDFLFQTHGMVLRKERNGWRGWTLYFHALIHTGLILLLFPGVRTIPCAFVIGFAHLLIDMLKPRLSRYGQRFAFIIDQSLHLAVILAVSSLFFPPAPALFSEHWILLSTCVIFLTLPVSVIIRIFISEWLPANNGSDSLKDAGRFIGILERLFVFYFIVSGHWQATGFLLAAKSVFRFGDLRGASDRKLTEYVLIGTLLSFGSAMFTAEIYRFLKMKDQTPVVSSPLVIDDRPFCVVLGTIQDGGRPQLGCRSQCCSQVKNGVHSEVSSLAIVDPVAQKYWLIDATPGIVRQVGGLQTRMTFSLNVLPDGIFLTHAHMGHYTGLMHLGREALGAKEVPVYCLPRMKGFLENNGPWDQLLTLNNISIREITDQSLLSLSPDIRITPLTVPHRDEYSETAGYLVNSSGRSLLYIPDIDKWETWKTDLSKLITRVDYALIDGTFFDGREVSGRNASEIPHPLVTETMSMLRTLPAEVRSRVRFIHMNHNNPLVNDDSASLQMVLRQGFRVAQQGEVLAL